MFIPARRARGRDAVCNRLPRLLSVATAGAVTAGAAFGLVPMASAEPPSGQGLNMMIDIVGDAYTAGEGIQGTYIDPGDQRHRSLVAPALQALSRLASGNPGLRVDANVVASSGAATANFFDAETGPDGQGGEAVVNPAQHDQVRPDAQVVIVGFGGNDAQFAQVLADAKPKGGNPAGSPLDTRIRNLGALLDSAASDEEYLGQARTSKLGRAPTLVARMLQVLAGVSTRAPQARIMVTNYPLAVDPQNKHAASTIGERDLTSVRKFTHDLNRAIERAVRICECATLVDVSGAVAGHEAYTSDSVFNERPGEQTQRELFHPNHKGASLMANPIAVGIARLLGVSAPAPSDGTITVPKNIDTRTGVPDRDGDTVPDIRDRAPNDPTRSQDAAKPVADKPVGDKAKADHPKAKRAPVPKTPVGKQKLPNRDRPSPAVVPTVIAKVVDSVLPTQDQAGSERDRPAPNPVPAVPEQVPAQDKAGSEPDPQAPKPVPAVTGQEPVQDKAGLEPDRRALKSVPARLVDDAVPALAGSKKSRPTGKKPSKFAAPPAQAPKRACDVVTLPVNKRVTGEEAAEWTPSPATTARALRRAATARSLRPATITPVIPSTDKARTPAANCRIKKGMTS